MSSDFSSASFIEGNKTNLEKSFSEAVSKCQVMNIHKTMNRAENHARLAIISSTMSVQTTVSHKLRRKTTSQKGVKLIRCQNVSLFLAIVKKDQHTRLEPSHG